MAFKKLSNVNFSEIYKRVPQNQMKQFLEFRNKSAEYQRRVLKFPERLPTIDWEYYRTNVRTDYVKMVDEFEKKYEELNKVFDSRDELDTEKYYDELKNIKCSVGDDIDNFICESNERIRVYEAEIERIRAMLPYEEMTLEEYCTNCPDRAICCQGKPSFWPHTPEEQMEAQEMKQKEKDEKQKEKAAEQKEKAAEQQQEEQMPSKDEVASGDQKNEAPKKNDDKKS